MRRSRQTIRAAHLCSLGVALALAGCGGRRNVPELLTLTDVLPTRVDVGERIDVMGVDLPSADVRQARVILRGDLFRPGRPPQRDQVIEVEGAEVSPDRVSFLVNDGLAERIVGRGEDALHTTFHGTLEVSMPSAASATPVFGTLRGTTTLDFFPRAPRALIAEQREHDARAALDFLGFDVDLADASNGLRVASVTPGSPAEKAGVAVGDRVESFEGVTAISDVDLVPSGTERDPVIALARGGARLDKPIAIDGFRSDTTRDLAAPAILLGSLIAIFFLLGTPPARVLTWLRRRIERGALRHRTNEGGAFARFSRFVSSVAHGGGIEARGTALAIAAPFLVFVGVSATFGVVPYLELRKLAELDAGVLYLLSVTSFAMVALVTGGHDAGSKASLWKSLRAFARALVCEVPAAIAIGAVVLSAGSFRLRDLAAMQLGPGGGVLETGAWPWYFTAVRSPQLLLLFLAFFVTVLVEPARPRALAGADDGSGGAASLRRSAFFFAEWTNVFIMCALASALFFGAWFVPGFSLADHESNGALAALGTALYLAKSWILVGVVMMKRVSLPRVRADVLLRLGLKYGLPMAVVAVGLTVIETLYPPVPTVALIVSGVTLATTAVISALFVAGFFRSDRSRGERTAASAIL